MEQPQYARMLKSPKALEADFDMLATYSLSPTYPSTALPNIPLTYYPLNIMHTSAVMQPPRAFIEKVRSVKPFRQQCFPSFSHLLQLSLSLSHSISLFIGKTGYNSDVTVALFTSNCKAAGAHERLAYVTELIKHIKVRLCLLPQSFAHSNYPRIILHHTYIHTYIHTYAHDNPDPLIRRLFEQYKGTRYA